MKKMLIIQESTYAENSLPVPSFTKTPKGRLDETVMDAGPVLKHIAGQVGVSWNKKIRETSKKVLQANASITTLKSVIKTESMYVNLIFVGETHTNAADRRRAEKYLESAADLHVGLTVMERQLPYNRANAGVTAREDRFRATSFQSGLGQLTFCYGIAARSAAIAGYIAACVYGEPLGCDVIMVYFGENHHDICDYFETIYRDILNGTKKLNCIVVPSYSSDLAVRHGRIQK